MNESPHLCSFCRKPFDGPMLMFRSFLGAHAACAQAALDRLLDPDAESPKAAECEHLWENITISVCQKCGVRE